LRSYYIEEVTGKPAPVKTSGREPALPFHLLKPGDSFFVACARGYISEQIILHNKRRKFHKEHFICRPAVKDGVPGFRVWRDL
jgi:hypothetical protein